MGKIKKSFLNYFEQSRYNYIESISSVFLLPALASMGIACFKLRVSLVEDPKHGVPGERKNRYTPKTFVSYMFTFWCLGEFDPARRAESFSI